ncbi:MAG: hypothetical protein P8013_15525 [Candidatus Sulfobium sp.]|jgi:hypothetical protein
MSLPYEKATSGAGALDDLRKILMNFGCDRFGTMIDNKAGELIVQFSYRGRDVTYKSSYQGYAAAWLKEHPYNPSRMRKTRQEHERQAMNQAQISVCSVLRDGIKGIITMIETGSQTFEGAFLGQILIPNTGKTILEAAVQTKMLPAVEDRRD